MNKLKTLLVNLSRALLALTFIFSGFVKAIDPLGSQYKIAEYLEAVQLSAYVPDWAQLMVSIALSAIEFTLGVMLLLAIRRRLASKISLLFMAVMTAVTLWLFRRCHTPNQHADIHQEHCFACCSNRSHTLAFTSDALRFKDESVDSLLFYYRLYLYSVTIESLSSAHL